MKTLALLELMLVIAILHALQAIDLPAYEHYTIEGALRRTPW